MNPWDPQSKRQYMTDGVYCALNAGNSQGGQAHGICYPINTMVAVRGGRDDMRTCFGIGEPGDPQFTISAAHSHAVCYAIEGNTVDRASAKNGRGWCENVSPTLNTQDRHAICFQLCGDRDDPSVSTSETAYCIPANPMSDRGQAVCYQK